MKMLRSVITNYENEFKSDLSEVIVNGFNEKQKVAFRIILENAELEDSVLNKKLARQLYDCNPSFSTYKSFKEKFSKDILKIVYLNKSSGSDLQKIVFELQEELLAINKLIYMGLRFAAEKQFNKTLSKALKYQNYEIARSLSLLIIDHYALYGKEKEQKDAIKKYRAISDICEQENEIKIIYGELIKYKEVTNEIKIHYRKILADLENRLEFDSYMYRCKFYQVKLILCKDNEYESICNEAISYFTKLWFNHSAYISIFRNRLLNFKISQGDFVKSKLVLNALMDDHRPFTYHWYLYSLTYVRVLLYSGDSREAFKWYHKIVESRNYKTLPKDHRNEWEVLGMYVYLMTDEIDSISIRKVKYNLNYNRVERSKNNINFLIAELFYEIKTGRPDIDRKINHLQKLSKGNKRVSALCRALKTGKKYKPETKASFDTEIVEHERLVSLI